MQMLKRVSQLALLVGLIGLCGCPGVEDFLDTVAVTEVSPASGPVTGGTRITVSGSGFVGPVAVLVGGVAATDILVINPTTLIAVTPPNPAGLTDVVVRHEDGVRFGFLADAFTYQEVPAPVVSSVTPSSGIPDGGTSVEITGENFVNGAVVIFGARAADCEPCSSTRFQNITDLAEALIEIGYLTSPHVKVMSSTTILARTPAHVAGPVDVWVRNPDGQSGKLAAGYTYVEPVVPAPTVTAISPSESTTAGDVEVTITGTGFSTGADVFGDGAQVYFGTEPAANVVVVNATEILARVPAHAAGVVDIVVRNPDAQTGKLPAAFTYVEPVEPAPTVTAISLAGSPVGGGAEVTITGTDFVDGAAVYFGTVAAGPVRVISDTEILTRVPAQAAGVVDIIVRNPDGQVGKLAGAFTYSDLSLTIVPPKTEAGAEVVITGVGFPVALTSDAVVSFDGVPATVTALSPTQLRVIVPEWNCAFEAGTVQVMLTEFGASCTSGACGTAFAQFTYLAFDLTPRAAPVGSTVVLKATGFSDFTAAGTEVSFLFGSKAAAVTVVDSNTLRLIVPDDLQATVNAKLTVQLADGTIEQARYRICGTTKDTFGATQIALVPERAPAEDTIRINVPGMDLSAPIDATDIVVLWNGDNVSERIVDNGVDWVELEVPDGTPGATATVQVEVQTNPFGPAEQISPEATFTYTDMSLLPFAAQAGDTVVATVVGFTDLEDLPATAVVFVEVDDVLVGATVTDTDAVEFVAPGGHAAGDVVKVAVIVDDPFGTPNQRAFADFTYTEIEVEPTLASVGQTVTITTTGFTDLQALAAGQAIFAVIDDGVNDPVQVNGTATGADTVTVVIPDDEDTPLAAGAVDIGLFVAPSGSDVIEEPEVASQRAALVAGLNIVTTELDIPTGIVGDVVTLTVTGYPVGLNTLGGDLKLYFNGVELVPAAPVTATTVQFVAPGANINVGSNYTVLLEDSSVDPARELTATFTYGVITLAPTNAGQGTGDELVEITAGAGFENLTSFQHPTLPPALFVTQAGVNRAPVTPTAARKATVTLVDPAAAQADLIVLEAQDAAGLKYRASATFRWTP